MNKKELKDKFLEYNIGAKGQAIFYKLYESNTELLNTINFEILSDKFITNFSSEELSRIVCDKKFQEALINLDDNKYVLFLKLKENFLTKDNWITGSNMIVKELNKPKFNKLLDSVLQSNNSESLKKYFDLINQDQDYFGIGSVEQLKNYEEIKSSVCNSILDNPENTEGQSEYIKNISTLDRIKFATIEKNYGISLIQAKLLCQKYGYNIEGTSEMVGNEKIHTLLKDLTQVILAKDLDQIKKLELTATNVENFNFIDTEIRESFAQMYNNTFYKPSEKDIIEEIKVDDKKVPIYNAGTNFYMCTHVVGAHSEGQGDYKSYPEAWNRPNRTNHVFCTRMISNESLEIAWGKKNNISVCYGFSDFENSALVASAPWDMASMQMNKQFDTIGTMDAEKNMWGTHEGSGSRFLTPIEQVNNTRLDQNETNWDRFSGNGEKKQPSYIIYIANSMINEDYKNRSDFQKSLLAASQHDIPLVMIDKEKVIENEHMEIENMLQKYEKTQNTALINRIIQKFENNRTTFDEEGKYQTEFPLRKNEDYLSLEGLVNKIVDISKNNENSIARYQQVIDELLVQAVKSVDVDEKDFCDIVYQVAGLDPSLSVDVDKVLKMHLGITQKDAKPQLCSENFLKSFYYKREGIIEHKEEKKKKFNSRAVDDGLQELSNETAISGFNDMSQNIKDEQRLVEQEQFKADSNWNKEDEGWGVDDDWE